MNQNDKFHNGVELNDDALDTVAGGVTAEDLQAFWDTGGQGAPMCTRHGGKKAYMKSYWKSGKVHLECTECGYIRII